MNNNKIVTLIFLSIYFGYLPASFFGYYFKPLQDAVPTKSFRGYAYEKTSFVTDKIGQITTTDEYLTRYNKSKYFKTIAHNIQIARVIMNAQGDGNCGYRAFLGSMFLNAIESGNRKIFDTAKNFIEQQFVPLFRQYDKDADQLFRTEEVRNYLIAIIDQLVSCLDIQSARVILNQEYSFDYYMIMFFRYLIISRFENDFMQNKNIQKMIDHINQKHLLSPAEEYSITQLLSPIEAIFIVGLQDELAKNFVKIKEGITIADRASFTAYKAYILEWCNQLTLDQAKILGLICNISVFIVSEENEFQPLAASLSLVEDDIVTLLYIPGHYRFFIPVSYDSNVLFNFFTPKKEIKHFATALDWAHDFWTNQDNWYAIESCLLSKAATITSETAQIVTQALDVGEALQKENSLDDFIPQYQILNQMLSFVCRILDKDAQVIQNLKLRILHLIDFIDSILPAIEDDVLEDDIFDDGHFDKLD